ncbi:DNA adenine methylase [Hydrogenobacter thermophilus TK-6]|uniref:Site-specific DNA-methyltransferase (adenine-specific) n=1 Tax=Hydrogenobacter thermophilus (strain DSM 6534 / IAM 12695 / TK-6) TaxID=608538 RepID=D3DJW3_HYDTT|nr:DNA adenine methylase [Hydrogenobacter thermophilus]ADO46036.1 DNA adenine methylase [Hydrogenobacter thermophilus TK-6]BAI70115.1 DNA adenine methylase [Hydrogenobacter thermophilus TK-6]
MHKTNTSAVVLNQLKKPKPFVKWAGGKRQLINLLIDNLPIEYDTYIEPFIGGGALLFEIMPDRAIINDINEELINAYKVIRDSLTELIESLKQHKNEEGYYYKVRSLSPDKLSPVERASRFIYLNKTCFNGLYRENSKGQFNVPFGKYKNPVIVDEENLKLVSDYLNTANVEIYNTDYKEICKLAKKGDFVYLDPPYYPLTKTASFTKYNKHDFTEQDHLELREVFEELDKKGCYVMLSNSNTEFVKELYRGYNILEIEANRFINCKGDKRGKAKVEILVKNY